MLSPMCIDVLSHDCRKAIEKFQMTMKEKEQYLAFYVRIKIPMSFHGMTTSPVEAMNHLIKHHMGVNHNSRSRYVSFMYPIDFIQYMHSYIM